jgi:hypothetical protein
MATVRGRPTAGETSIVPSCEGDVKVMCKCWGGYCAVTQTAEQGDERCNELHTTRPRQHNKRATTTTAGDGSPSHRRAMTGYAPQDSPHRTKQTLFEAFKSARLRVTSEAPVTYAVQPGCGRCYTGVYGRARRVASPSGACSPLWA